MIKNKPYDFPDNFKSFALMPKFDENIDALALLAENEDWSYKATSSTYTNPVLRNYLLYTYKRIAEEKKTCDNDR